MSKKIKYGLLLFAALIVAISAWQMYTLYEVEELWGHWPLFFFAAAWLLLKLSIFGRKERTGQEWRWLGLSTLSGVILSLGFPPIPLPFLMFFGFVPLLYVEKEISDLGAGTFKKKLIPYAYNTFVIWNILTTWWVGNTAFVAGIVAIWLNAFFMCIPFLLFHHVKKAVPRTAYLAFVTFWLCFEWLHLNWEISWVWLNLGNAFADVPSLVQWYEYTGTFGGSLWILAANVLLFKYLSEYFFKDQKVAALDLLQALVFFFAPLMLSIVMYYTYEEKGEEIEVVVAQPNYEPHFQKFTIDKKERDLQVLDLALSSVSDNTEYFILPETVFNSVDEDKPEKNESLRVMSQVIDSFPRVKIISGVNAYNILKRDEPDTKATRTSYRSNGAVKMRYESLNAAVQIQKDQPAQLYRKSVFVPGAELLPYRDIFFWLKPLVDKLDGSMSGLGTQPERSVFTSETSSVAPVICYESVFGEYSTGYIRKGADFIAIMTNDGWWDNTAGHKQHLAFASLRAIETRRDIARSANTGISAFINQKGDIVSATKYDERTALKGTVRLNKEYTFYTRWQDLIARIAHFTAVLLILNTFVKGRLVTPTNNQK